MDKVSVIVPVYNVSSFLDRCMESLLKQTYNNLEIVLVDDESTDDSLAKCYEYQKKDCRIVVFSKKNGGAASARNFALDNITGKFVVFVDSDDYVESNYIEKLMYILIDNQADISICSFINEEGRICKEHSYNIDSCNYDTSDYLLNFLNDWTSGLLWNKMFKASLLEKIRFPVGHIIDDEFFTYKVVMNAKKISFQNVPLYHYCIRSNSLMNSEKNKKLIYEDRLLYLRERLLDIIVNFSDLKELYLDNYIDNIIRIKHEMAHTKSVHSKMLFMKIKKEILYLLISESFPIKYSIKRGILVLFN